jgi:L-2-hydroxyglutarate oxidase LhgO
MDAEITIIGAGVVGLAIASTLSGCGLNIYVLEKNRTHGMEISSRNSEVIHAGIYYPPDSLKARLCMEGRQLLYDTCKKNNIPHRKTGKLIIAGTMQEMEQVENLYRNAIRSGVQVTLIENREINRMEPNIKAVGALFSPETGIISAHALMDYYACNAKMNGAEIVYGTRVVGIERMPTGYKLKTLNVDGEYFELDSERVVNAAGLHSDTIARMTGRDCTLHYCKGDYFSINNIKSGLVKRLIYPVPEKNHIGLGIHLTMDLNGRLKLGPDANYINREEDYRVDASKRDIFHEAAAKYLPFIKKEDIVPDMSGIRPKLRKASEGFSDFSISEDLPGFINLVGIESPGLTASPAIANHVGKLLNTRRN